MKDAIMHAPASAVAAPAPERFGRLFDREEAVCTYRDQGQLTSEYVARLLRAREVEEAEEVEEEVEEEAAEDAEDAETVEEVGVA